MSGQGSGQVSGGPPGIEPARDEDVPAIVALLEAAGLPTQHLEEGSAALFVAWDGAGRAVGCVGLERHGSAGLLRSVAVGVGERGRGIGRALVERALTEAGAAGVAELVLLTMGAGPFFRALGFEPAPREAIDPALLDSWEFRLHERVPAELLRRRL